MNNHNATNQMARESVASGGRIMEQLNCCSYDFEFARSKEKELDLICCSFRLNNGPVSNVWVYHNDKAKEELANILDEIGKTHIFVCYYAAAECRALLSLGLNPLDYKHLDLYVAFRQLQFNNNIHLYGRHIKKKQMWINKKGEVKSGHHGYSTPPSFDPDDNIGMCNQKVGVGLIDCLYHMLGIYRDSAHKKKMQQLCVSAPASFTSAEQKDILEYCNEDVESLDALQDVLISELSRFLSITPAQVITDMLNHSRFAGPVCAIMETNGIPVNTKHIANMVKNEKWAKRALTEKYIEDTAVPFYAWEKKTLKESSGHYSQKYSLFEEYVKSIGLNKWPHTVKDDGTYSTRLSMDRDEMKEHGSHDANINAFRHVKNLLNGLRSFNPNSESAKKNGTLLSSVGSDDRLRVLMSPFGSQTGRCQQRASKYIFLMAAWCRCLVRPPKGKIIIALDWSNQEFAIAAALSGDANMLTAYLSGDFYLHFGKMAGLIPQQGTKKTHPTERQLCKGTCLGIQFGMGEDKLAKTLSRASGRVVTVKEAQKLRNKHKKTFKKYWKWIEKITRDYKIDGVLRLGHDGWSLLADCDSLPSMRNFPVQGTGAAIMRSAVVKAVEAELEVICPLHDAIYILCDEEDEDEATKTLTGCMDEASTAAIGRAIRIDKEVHRHEDVWIEEHAQETYDVLKEYLTSEDNPEDLFVRKVEKFLERQLTMLSTQV